MMDLHEGLVSFEEAYPNKEMCYQHPEEKLRIYCHSCKSVICLICLCSSHERHHYSYVETAGEELRKLIDNSVNLVSNRIARHNQQRKEIQDEHKKFLDSADQIEQTARDSEKRMKIMLEDNLKSLLKELNDLKEKTRNEVENATQQLDEQLNEMRKFKIEAEGCRDHGSALEVASNGPRLATRADKLNQLKVRPLIQKLNFRPSEWAGKGCADVIGKLSGLSSF